MYLNFYQLKEPPFGLTPDPKFIFKTESYLEAVSTVKYGIEQSKGIVVVVGLAGGRVPFGLGAVPHEAQLMSSIWGTVAELHELLAFAARNPIESTVEVLPLDHAQTAHERLRAGAAAGRLVLVP